ncbi:penicillin-binding protein 1C [Lutimaribacter sp. EGI FJ00015]|uniref:Penicillin-binding protein 1C n=1 Tax=Lutimaribacter degradans TaxID=2945989 RepID=A0ACC5ZW47_9RHOB|nr:penicillin-binding protein 1C [Lutimaribacter sp. EGI FJ00013]MCM2562583.1 penicillin-binding protein 1C [Lutimaribacter sp. EGI FJ00013]MCO0613740.1 penicillin-binding protein 1C [Lutimaribacter sp. EGI FJ00015]MCO0636777.1 penicillin-binding protein 1C [Lutimaribacter sp. EGI FJ00014]
MPRVERLLALAVLVLISAAAARDAFDRWVDATVLPPTLVAQSVEIRDRSGQLLRAYPVENGRWRLGARSDQVDPTYLEMLFAYEDRRFASHAGVDLLGLLRAAGQAVGHGRVVSGGSTLTMQVARLLENSGTGAWRGKLRQIRVALALERQIGKDEILSLYLTLAPFGGNIEGVRAATLAWFGKEPARLTPAQAALLIALPQSPEARRPDRHHRAATRARDRVLARMVGAGVLSPYAASAARSEPVPASRRPFPMLAPHLGDRLHMEDPTAPRHDVTVDAQVQRGMEDLARGAVAGQPARLSVAILVADHRTGEVLASVGSPDYAAERRQGFVDMTRALRSPGSTLKPLIYALGFDQGLAHPQTLIADRPTDFGGYAPQNFDGGFRGELTVERALQLSLNVPAVAMMQAVGPARLVAAMERAGAQPVIPGGRPGLAVALGGVGVSLRDLVQIYAGIANGGRAVGLRSRDGPTKSRRLTTARAAWSVGHVLAGLAPPPGSPNLRLAYKTGTSYGYRDAWAVGYDGRHVVGVWMGRADGTPVPGAFGGELAAPVLFRAFTRLKPRIDPLPPPPADALLVSTDRLPAPLQRFRGRDAAFAPDENAPKLAFPPDGARLALEGGNLVIKLRDGIAPFTVLANGNPMQTGARRREITLPAPGPGFVTLSVIDAHGRAARARIRVD